MLNDLQTRLRPVGEIADAVGLREDEIELYGRFKAKVSLSVLERLKNQPNGKHVVVTAVTPTPLGEGKTVTAIGLGQAMARLGKRAIVTIRQPSMGPLFGVKGGATGGGKAQVAPMEDVNLHFTGDFHAVAAAHNLLAAMVDAALFHGVADLDPHSIAWTRVLDVCDRALRHVVVGLGGKLNGVPREATFEITAASEVMALLSLTTGLRDLRERLGRVIVGSSRGGKFVTAEELKAAGAMTVLLKDALMPNLVQTLERTPALIHTGPFGNIADGQSSVIADQIALKLADYVVTESGFGADLGFEKFCHIKARVGGFTPAVAVVVCSVRAVKMHSGKFDVKTGKPLPPALLAEDLDALRAGAENLKKHVAIVRSFGVPVVAAVNRFPTDSDAEVGLLRRIAEEIGADETAISEVYQRGGEGGTELAEAVVRAVEKPNNFRPLYALAAPLEEKIATIAAQVYGTDGVAIEPSAQKKLRAFADAGYGNLPVCMAKTQYSLSHDATLLNVPRGFTLPIRDVRLFAGAGMIVPLCGDVLTMPGLSASPAAMRIDVDEEGKTVGLS